MKMTLNFELQHLILSKPICPMVLEYPNWVIYSHWGYFSKYSSTMEYPGAFNLNSPLKFTKLGHFIVIAGISVSKSSSTEYISTFLRKKLAEIFAVQASPRDPSAAGRCCPSSSFGVPGLPYGTPCKCP